MERDGVIKIAINYKMTKIVIDSSRKKYTNSKLDVTIIGIKLNGAKESYNLPL